MEDPCRGNKPDYLILSKSLIQGCRKRLVAQLKDETGLSEIAALKLLNISEWNKEKAIDNLVSEESCLVEGDSEVVTSRLLEQCDSHLLQSLLKKAKNVQRLKCPKYECSIFITSTTPFNETNFPADINCDCGYSFCTKCLEKSHPFSSCGAYVEWNRELKELIRRCPDCSSIVEKQPNQLNATCKSCQLSFCWNCFNDLMVHRTEDIENCNLQLVNCDKLSDFKKQYQNSLELEEQYLKKKKALLDNVGHHPLSDSLIEALDTMTDIRRRIAMTYVAEYLGGFGKDMLEVHRSVLNQALDELEESVDCILNTQPQKELFDWKINIMTRKSGLKATSDKLTNFIQELQCGSD